MLSYVHEVIDDVYPDEVEEFELSLLCHPNLIGKISIHYVAKNKELLIFCTMFHLLTYDELLTLHALMQEYFSHSIQLAEDLIKEGRYHAKL